MKELAVAFLKWANRDRVCAAALFLGVVGAFPHALDSLGRFIQVLVPIAEAIGGK